MQFLSTIVHFGNLQNINTRAFSKNMIINIDWKCEIQLKQYILFIQHNCT